ncbi:hypothetical protein Cni_G00683 [Canna indica]|uniref:Uncharacterized protein n=1 Tax=Canna indica TaxID=4628 RepID=A0AAQ3JLR9_9LILI|nr:hypothetical protein Cni_G00683 [Canna indica]
MDGGEGDQRHGPAPVRVCLAHLASPSPRCLSSSFAEPRRLVPPAGKKIAWFSLQGRLVGAEEATSAVTIGGGLGGVDAVAWDLFSPLQRVLVVAVIATASKRARKIAQLQRSIELRDELLLGMQQKLDSLCDQMNCLPNEAVKCIPGISFENNQFDADLNLAQVASQCTPLAELNPESGMVPLCKNLSSVLYAEKDIMELESAKEEVFNVGNTVIMEQEERRMSDLSDFNWSVSSSLDFQLSTLATEQEFYNLHKECEEKDMQIKELTAANNAIKAADSKRIMELEDIIKRKNLVISKLKKDMAVLEKQVVELTRLRRSSSTNLNDSSAASNSNSSLAPVMTTNILYDMSSTSSSSSDSDSPVNKKEYHVQLSVAKGTPCQNNSKTAEIIRNPLEQNSINMEKSTDSPPKKLSISPLKENRRIQRSEPASASRQRRLTYSSESFKRSRKAAPHKANNLSAMRRWS